MKDSPAMTVRGLRWLAFAYFVGALACGVYVVAERHVERSHSPDFLVLYGDGGKGLSRGNWFDPFQPPHPYLWLGFGTGLLVTAATLLLVAYRMGRDGQEAGPLS